MRANLDHISGHRPPAFLRIGIETKSPEIRRSHLSVGPFESPYPPMVRSMRNLHQKSKVHLGLFRVCAYETRDLVEHG